MNKRITSGIAAFALLLNVTAPALASSSIIISGNGSNTDNTANVTLSQTTTVVQDNNASVSNNVNVDANTGGNNADKNTGGSVSIDTGDADVQVGVSTTANSNVANVEGCDCDSDTEVLIAGNGEKSDNDVNLKTANTTDVYQENDAKINNHVDVDATTGNNNADKNTGGSVSIETGDADVVTAVTTAANSNSATVGGSSGGGSTLSARILGNGTKSDNDLVLTLKRGVLVTQDNDVSIKNWVDVDGTTGDNGADKNTGGTVSIDTGDADVAVLVDNMANFNAADVDCGCLLDVVAKIADNGYKSDNDIKATLESGLDIYQENDCGGSWMMPFMGLRIGQKWPFPFHHSKPCFDNTVDVDADTGYNGADKNTAGDWGGDPSVETGDASTEVYVGNTGNSNVYGEAPDMDFDWPGGSDVSVNFTFDLADLLAFLGLS